MAISVYIFRNETRFRFIEHVLVQDEGYTHISNTDLAKKWATEFGFSLDYIDPEKFDNLRASSAFNEGPEALEEYIKGCSL